jgi:hypothetical protein
MGLRKVVVTHAEFPSQNLTAAEQLELAESGRDHRALFHHHAYRAKRRGKK